MCVSPQQTVQHVVAVHNVQDAAAEEVDLAGESNSAEPAQIDTARSSAARGSPCLVLTE